MRYTPPGMETTWRSGDYTGSKATMRRVTIQHPQMRLDTYELQSTFRRVILDPNNIPSFNPYPSGLDPTRGEPITQTYADYLFSAPEPPKELPNVKSISWTRSMDTDVAQCTVELYNTAPLPLGETPNRSDLDQPGFYCADPSTEVLSRRGWLTYDQLQVGDLVYSVNVETGKAQWSPVREVFAKRYTGEMVSIEGRSFSALVTSNHRWAVTNKGRTARGDDSLVVKRTHSLARHDQIPLIRFSESQGTDDDHDFAALVGWVVTDGTYQKPGNGQRVIINQSVTANPEKVAQIKGILERLGGAFGFMVQGSQGHFRFSGDLARRVRAAAPDKKLTLDYIESLTHKARGALYEALIDGDGTRSGGREEFGSNSAEQAGIFAALCARLGVATTTAVRNLSASEINGRQVSATTMHYVTARKSRYTKLADCRTTAVQYDDIVWCPVTDTGTWYARRNGRTYFTGNTAGRGKIAFSSRWGHVENEWTGMLVPDNIIRTYEGYGTDTALGEDIGGDGYVSPESDSKLMLTGVWMIDEVKLSVSGIITVTARDLGRLLLDHQSFLPVVPEDFYPVSFEDWSDKVMVQSQRNVITESNNVEELNVSVVGSGNDLWPESSGSGARVYGHTHTLAHDGDGSSYWLSVGNPKPSYRSAYEYIDIAVDNATVTQLSFWTVKTGYNAYVSVKQNGVWVPGPIMGYHRDGRGRYEEGVPYIASVGGLGAEGENVLSFGPITNVTMIRLWLSNLPNFGLAGPAKYRAAIREIKVRGPVFRHTETLVVDSSEVALKPGPTGANPGRCQDYTDVIKLFCAWAGLFWPTDGYLLHSDGVMMAVAPAVPDQGVLGDGVRGRVWGDFQVTGVAPVELIDATNFDKKTLMDGVSYIRDTIGFLFLVDETGAVQWRLQNVWTIGSWVTGVSPQPGRTSKILTIDERQVLMGLEASLNSTSVREGVFVANATGAYAALAPGFNPNDTGLRRVAGWTDQNFSSVEEATVMADLITVRQLFEYRRDTVQIPGFPGIQIDDQVRIFERVTSEGFVHYVMGISSNNDAESGQWTYDLQTHWLGDDPNSSWIFDRTQLSPATTAYIDSLINGTPEWVRAGLDV